MSADIWSRCWDLRLFTSCGGISYVAVLRSIFSYTSTQGITKKTPGPRAPPVSSLPNRKMTALSYSLNTVFKNWKLYTLLQRSDTLGEIKEWRSKVSIVVNYISKWQHWKSRQGDKCIIHSVNNLNKRRMCATEGTSREWRRKIFNNMKLLLSAKQTYIS